METWLDLLQRYLLPLLLLLALVVHIVLAASVAADATTLERQGKLVYFVGPVAWGLVVLLFGLAGLYVYWVLHHSNLRRPIDPM